MNKTEKLAVALLFAILIGWGFVQRAFFPPAQITEALPVTMVADSTNEWSATTQEQVTASLSEPRAVVEEPAATNAIAVPAMPTVARRPEETIDLSNDSLSVSVSSWGGGIRSAALLGFRAALEKDSGTLLLDFASLPALSLEGIPGLSATDEFRVVGDGSGTGAVLTASSPGGWQLERRVTLSRGYSLTVTDTFRNAAATPISLPEYGMNVGPMTVIQTQAKSQGDSYLGIDTLPDEGGRPVTHWGKKKIPEFFGQQSGLMGCARSNADDLPPTIRHRTEQAVSWAAAKNKFFVQILRPDGGADDCELYAERGTNSARGLTLEKVSASLIFDGKVCSPGEIVTRTTQYYVGPKKHDSLKLLGFRQDEVMQFGWWAWFRWACVLLLATLNAIHSVIPDYGIAIILLTIIVKVVFWPLTHKGTESAKKMQTIQPLVAELRAKYKDQPQKMQQAQMALYKEHGVNPMASCLPMLVQLPIFIALFTVLRSAVELRFAPFLWIPDLSEPEGLFAASLPIPLNILPILMTVTMVFQQRLTPTGGDPQQQKMMMMMPVVMLFVLYNMPSALVLYWTVSQSLSIAQLMYQKRKKATKTAV